MKNLLFFTAHNQTHCFEYWCEILEKNEFLKTFDIIICTDNGEEEKNNIIEKTNNYEVKPLVITTEVVSGYVLGLFEDLSYCFEHFQKYDYVFHLHPDVYILDDSIVKQICEKNLENDFSILVSDFAQEQDCYNTDFFIFKPKLLKNNIFKDAKEIYNTQPTCAERILIKLIKNYNLNYFKYLRYNDGLIRDDQRRKDLLNIIHTHDKLPV